MIKRRTRNILILTLCVYVLIGIAFFFYIRTVQNDFPKEITVEVNGTTTSLLKIGEFNLKPGEDREYVVNLKSKVSGDYKINLDFTEITYSELKRFINVEIIVRDDESYYRTLSELLDSEEKIEFMSSLKWDMATRILIRFHMPIEVGNEAQGTVADFNVVLTATYAE